MHTKTTTFSFHNISQCLESASLNFTKLHTNDFVHSVMVIKGDKAEPSLFPGGSFLHDVDAVDPSIDLEVLSYVVLLSVLLDATDKDLLHRQMGTRFGGVLKQTIAMMSTPQTAVFAIEMLLTVGDFCAGQRVWSQTYSRYSLQNLLCF